MTWAPDYCTVAEVKSYLRIDDTADDVLLALWVTAASRAVDKHCGRQFGQVATAETREYQTQWDRHLGRFVAQIDDVQDVDDLTVIDSSANVLTDYELGPVNAAQKGRPYERLITSAGAVNALPAFPFWAGPQPPQGAVLTVDALWGWTSVPPAVKAATLLQTARLAARRDSPFGVAGSPSDGSEMRLLAVLDPDLKTSLTAFRRDWWAA